MQSKTKLNKIVGTTALYCRLSRDDGAETESNSIANQKRMLEKKAKEYGLNNTRCYVDDGYTGTNFNRPGFQQMLDDIEAGYVTTVMVKDLSRLGRYAPTVGMYMDSYFPEHDVRFIAVNDLVDSADGENEIAPFKNVMNEMYARDISKKVRSAHRIRGNCGEPLGQPPYGYIKDPLNRKSGSSSPARRRSCLRSSRCVSRARAMKPSPAFSRNGRSCLPRRTGSTEGSSAVERKCRRILVFGNA